MPVLLPKAVEAIGKGRLQPLHSSDEISQWSLECEVVVVAHDHKGMQQPLATSAAFKKAGLERGPRSFFGKNPVPVIAAIDHVIDRTGVFEPKLARHPRSLRRLRSRSPSLR